MDIKQYIFALLVAFSLAFAGEAEAKGKHGSQQARSRVLKEISKKTGCVQIP